MGEVRLRGSLRGLKAVARQYGGRERERRGTLTMNGSLRRSICANALKRTNVRTKNTDEWISTDWEFVRKCGSASSDDNRSREASSHVR